MNTESDRSTEESATQRPGSATRSTAEQTVERLEKLAGHMPRSADSPFWSVQVIASTHGGVRRAGETIITHAESQIGAILHALAATNIDFRDNEDVTLFAQTARETR